MKNKLKQALNASNRESYNHHNAKAALRNFKERNQIILEGIEEGYVEVGISGNIMLCNDACCKIFGFPKEELVGLNYQAYMDGAMAKTVFAAYNNVYLKREPNE